MEYYVWNTIALLEENGPGNCEEQKGEQQKHGAVFSDGQRHWRKGTTGLTPLRPSPLSRKEKYLSSTEVSSGALFYKSIDWKIQLKSRNTSCWQDLSNDGVSPDTEYCGGYTHCALVQADNSPRVLGADLWVPGSCMREWTCLEKYFERQFGNPKVPDNQRTEQRVLSAPLTSSQALHPTNVTTRMCPIWADPKRQPDHTPAAETPLQVSETPQGAEILYPQQILGKGSTACWINTMKHY